MKKLNKNSADEDAINCLVIGTEDAHIHIIESEAFTALATVEFMDIFRHFRSAGNNFLDELSCNTFLSRCIRCLRC